MPFKTTTFLTLLTFTMGPAVASCPSGFSLSAFDAKCYLKTYERKDFGGARTLCRTYGGHLPVVGAEAGTWDMVLNYAGEIDNGVI